MNAGADFESDINAGSGAAASAQEMVLEQFTPFQLSVIASAMTQSMAKLFEQRFDIHVAEWRILMSLAGREPSSALEIAARTAMDPARVSRAQQRLSDLGLVDSQTDPADRRRLMLRLTAKGRGMITEMVPEARRQEAALLEPLSAEERGWLVAIMEKLFQAVARTPGGAT